MRAHAALSQRFDAAESAGLLLAPKTQSERESLRRRVAAGEVIQPFPGLFARHAFLENVSPRVRAFMVIKTLARVHPDWVFCSFSAAVMHGLQVSYAQVDKVHVCVARGGNRRRRPGYIQCHAGDLEAYDDIQGVRVTSIEQTVLDCLCQSDFRQGLAIVDSALHCGLTSRAALTKLFNARGRRRRGIVQARETLLCSDARSESGGESVVRAVILELGFATPELQFEVVDPLELGNTRRVDMAWRREDGSYVFLEVDGKVKYLKRNSGKDKTLEEMASTFSKERLRESHLNLTGATVLRCAVGDAYETDRFFTMLARAGVPRAGG